MDRNVETVFFQVTQGKPPSGSHRQVENRPARTASRFSFPQHVPASVLRQVLKHAGYRGCITAETNAFSHRALLRQMKGVTRCPDARTFIQRAVMTNAYDVQRRNVCTFSAAPSHLD